VVYEIVRILKGGRKIDPEARMSNEGAQKRMRSEESSGERVSKIKKNNKEMRARGEPIYLELDMGKNGGRGSAGTSVD